MELGIGERIAKLRKALKLTQGGMAAQLGISQQHISQMEKNIREPSEQLLKHICALYNTTMLWLATGEGEMFVPCEEIIKNQISRMGERHYYQALKNLVCDKGLIIMESAAPYFAAGKSCDPDLEHMISFLNDLWMFGDENLKTWARVQFARAFPPDIEEEVQKKRGEKQGRKSIG